MARYPFNIDVSTAEGKLEVLRLWSEAELDVSSALLILKMTTNEFLKLAEGHGFAPPSEEALQRRVRELEAIVRPQLRKRKRDRAAKELSDIRTAMTEVSDRLASIAFETEVYGQVAASQLYSITHAKLQRAIDVIASTQQQFEDARSLENNSDDDFEYNEVSIVVLRALEPVVPRPDYYLIGDFNHVDPVTDYDIVQCWSQGFLATRTAAEMLGLEEGDKLRVIAYELEITIPKEEAMLPSEAAAVFDDPSIDEDAISNVRRRIRDGRLASYFPSDVAARKEFEDAVKRRSDL